MNSGPPKTDGLLETALYVEDVTRSVQFYETIFGFPIVSDFRDRGCALQAGHRQVLLLFQKDASRDNGTTHFGHGELHLAIAVSPDELTVWEAWLNQNAVAIEERRTWPLGGTSLYFRDPDRHLLELATPGVWSIY